MTSFVAWVGVDSRGPSSVYLASDSRISWGKDVVWDYGRKLFASQRSPELLGYVGDVLFPSLVLGQLTSAIDIGSLLDGAASPSEKWTRIQAGIKQSFGAFPLSERRSFTVVYATRELEGKNCRFYVFTLSWDVVASWSEAAIPIPSISDNLSVLGSGAGIIQRWKQRWDSSSQGGTSRAVFSAFCDALHSGEDLLTGGAPQLVGLYRQGPGRAIGIVYKSKPFVFGLQTTAAHAPGGLEWRNTLFERCDPTGRVLAEAQRHHAPRGLGKSEA